MRNYLAQNKGFTLIELLIVIALLGALAVGLLATIDPFEQLKKGRDTSQRNTLSELYNGVLRYDAIKGFFPWNDATSVNETSGTVYPSFGDTISALVLQGELKSKFQDLAGTGNLAKMYLYADTSGTAYSVCFKPESKSFQGDPNTIYDQSGGTSAGYGTSCSGAGAGGTSLSCYYCIQ